MKKQKFRSRSGINPIKFFKQSMSKKCIKKIIQNKNHFLLDVLSRLFNFIKFTQYKIIKKAIFIEKVKEISAIYNLIPKLTDLSIKSLLDLYNSGLFSRFLFFDLINNFFKLDFELSGKDIRFFNQYLQLLFRIFGIKNSNINPKKLIKKFLKNEIKILDDYIFLYCCIFSYSEIKENATPKNGFLSEKIRNFLISSSKEEKQYLEYKIYKSSCFEWKNNHNEFFPDIFRIMFNAIKCKITANRFIDIIDLDLKVKSKLFFSKRNIIHFTDIWANPKKLIDTLILVEHKHLESFKNVIKHRKKKSEMIEKIVKIHFIKHIKMIQKHTQIHLLKNEPIYCFCFFYLYELFINCFKTIQSSVKITVKREENSRKETIQTSKCLRCGSKNSKIKFRRHSFVLNKDYDVKESNGNEASVIDIGLIVESSLPEDFSKFFFYKLYFFDVIQMFQSKLDLNEILD